MSVYYILLISSFGFFLLQWACSFIFGDLDIDTDADIDGGDVLSFKGVVHFLMGFSIWTSSKLYLAGAVTPTDIVIGGVLGMVFMYGLYKLYKFIYKFLKCDNNMPEDLVGKEATIITVLNKQDKKYLVNIVTNGTLCEYVAYSENIYYRGDTTSVEKFINNKIYLK